MELKVFKNGLTAYGGRWETRLELPVETELLIPDYQQAIFKIVKCLVEPVLMQNRVTGNRWQGEGYLRCTVYYQSDEAGAQLYRAEQKFPFDKTVELPEGAYMQGPCQLRGEPEYVNCRAVNEHRIDLRGAYVLYLSVEAVREQELLTSLADCGIEQRTERILGCTAVAAEEKVFTAEDTVPLPGAGESILDISGYFSQEEAGVLPGQINCRGTLHMQVCYRPAGEGETTCREKELPIRQTVELAGAAEGDIPVVWGEVLGSILTAGNDPQQPTLTVTWKLHIELWHPNEYMAVADAYSTVCQTQTERSHWQLLQQVATLAETVRVSAEDDLPSTVAEIKGCFVTLGLLQPVSAAAGEAESENTILAGKGVAHILAADERGELSCLDKAFTWQSAASWPGTPDLYTCHHYAAVTGVRSAKEGERLRVSLEIGLAGALFCAKQVDTVSEVSLGEVIPDKNEGPALYLYYAEEGERVFDIAKRYHARAKDLAAANGLEAPPDQPLPELRTKTGCLLIPAAL
ncbi:MAG: DUF3794 domain-containing protein [Gemmiger sp.]|nr:DUF3794 domain-containing protein [Gemmiger sp.]